MSTVTVKKRNYFSRTPRSASCSRLNLSNSEMCFLYWKLSGNGCCPFLLFLANMTERGEWFSLFSYLGNLSKIEIFSGRLLFRFSKIYYNVFFSSVKSFRNQKTLRWRQLFIVDTFSFPRLYLYPIFCDLTW